MECRRQYSEANRPDAVPCDEGGIPACPYVGRPMGSPGDTSEDGCGLAEENVAAVEFYPKWKALGEAAFSLLQIETGDEYESDEFTHKLLLIDMYAPAIDHAINSQEAKPEKPKGRQGPRKA